MSEPKPMDPDLLALFRARYSEKHWLIPNPDARDFIMALFADRDFQEQRAAALQAEVDRPHGGAMTAAANTQGPSLIASRIHTADGAVLHVLVFEAEDLPGTWVAHILDCDVVTQGTSPGDAIDMALDAWDCVPPEGRDRPAPAEDWQRWPTSDP